MKASAAKACRRFLFGQNSPERDYNLLQLCYLCAKHFRIDFDTIRSLRWLCFYLGARMLKYLRLFISLSDLLPSQASSLFFKDH
jgi:hypothetical protein